MATLNIPYSFSNNTVADANNVNDNFLAVKNFAEASVVQIDGSVKAGTGAIADGAVTSAKIADGTIVDADINASAAIALSKLGSGTAAISISGNAATATSATSATSATNATNATNATTAANLTGFARGTVVTTFINVTAGGKTRMLVSFPHGLGGQPSGAAVYNGDHNAMTGLFHVYSVDATNITVEAPDYNNSFISIIGRIYWMAYR